MTIRHPSEQTIGRIRKDGGWDRRYRAGIRGSRYASEVSDRAIEQARRKVARRDQAQPIDLDEPVTWPRIAGLTVFAFGLIFVFPFALLVIVEAVLA